jgi:hypothetical protein
VFPANSHLVRAATAHDAKALRKLAAVSGARPLAGRVLVAEVRGVIAAAISRDRVSIARQRKAVITGGASGFGLEVARRPAAPD